MKTNLLQKISVKLVAAFISIALLITGVCYIGIEGNVVQAATLETAVTANGEGYYVKDYTGAEFNAYKNESTYPKMVTEKDDDVQEWLFAGWYQEKDDTNGTCKKAYDSATTAVGEDATVYAKFVPASVMAVKCQVTPGTDVDSEKANMRLISTTDSADYIRMGFHVVYKGKTLDCYTTTLYKRVAASDDGMECNYSANAFDIASNYFFAVRLTNIGNANFAEPFYIEPYWVTADGTTVTGVSRYARVEDSYKKIVNIPVRLYSDEQVTNGEVSLSYNATQFELYGLDGTTKKYGVAGETKIAETVFDNVTYTEPVVDTENMATIILKGSNTAVDEDTPAVTAHGIFANVRLQLKEGQLIESNTSFKVADETFTNKNSESSSVTLDVANVIYKNYTMDYTGGSDTSWYDEFAEEDTFVISTAADLYGLAKIVNDTTTELYKNEQFSGKTIKLGADITINTSALTPDEYEDAEEGVWDAVIASAHKWTPIGTNSYRFEGTFDGQGNDVSGIYIPSTIGSYAGLFGVTQTGSMILNFELKNTYIDVNNSKAVGIGSIVGYLYGNVQGVSSDAYIKVATGSQQLGGIAGLAWVSSSDASDAVSIDNCRYAGTMDVATMKDIGGIVGSVTANNSTAKNIVITDCLFTGLITSNVSEDAIVGGILGRDNANACDVYITNCISDGTITTGTNATSVGAFLGKNRSGSYTIKDCYTTTDMNLIGTGATGTLAGKVTISLGDNSVSGSKTTPPTSLDGVYLSRTGSDGIEGHYAYANANLLDYYTNADKTGAWVVTESGIPALKSFCDEWIDVAWYYDNKDTEDTFVIYTPEELYGFSALSQDINFSGNIVTLGNDIMMNSGKATSWYAGTTTPKRIFKPIGKDLQFAGMFNGNNFTVSGIYVYDKTTSNNIGFFARTNGTIENFRLKNSYIVNANSKNATGGIVGKLEDGTLLNIYCNAIVKSSGGSYTAGIVGVYDGTTNVKQISNCWFEGIVETKGRWAGGIVGRVNTGTLGIDNCISNGDISSSSTSSYGANAGGIIGSVTADNTSSAVIKNCLVMNDVSAPTNVGSVVGGINQIVRFENVYTSKSVGDAITGVGKISDNTNVDESVTGEPILLDINELTGENAYIYTDFDFETVWGVVADGTPVLRSLYSGTVESDLTAQRISTNWYYNNTQYDSTLENSITSYEIQDVNDLFGLARLVNAGNSFANKRVELKENGDFNLSSEDYKVTINDDGTATVVGETNLWTPIGTSAEYAFKGTFDGNNNTIQGVYVNNGSDNTGFFGLTSGATLQDFRLENSYIGMSATKNYVGGIVGRATNSSLMNIYSNAAVIATKGTHQGVGGLAGIFEAPDGNGTISNCWFEGTVNTKGRQVGGIVGRVYQNGKDSVNGGQLLIQDCISNGIVKSTYQHASGTYLCNIGGIAGAISVDNTVNDMLVEIINSLSLSIIISSDETGGTVVGNLAESTTFENVYTTGLIEGNEIDGVWINNGAIIEGQPVVLSQTALTGEDAYIYTELDFTNVWGIVKDGTPVLRSLYNGTVEENVSTDRISTGWYYNSAYYNASTVDSTVDYSISTADDLRGLAKLVNDGIETFAAATFTEGESTIERKQRTITLSNNITVYEGKATDWENDESTRPETSWTPIGKVVSDDFATYCFQGVLDGANNTIEGIYLKTDATYAGLFGNIYGATIQNVRLKNSYFESSTTDLGSISGAGYGTLDNVYSNAIVQGSSTLGGLIGRINTSGSKFAMTNCWFDGRIVVDYSGSGNVYAGGLVGYANQGINEADGCLYTGNMAIEVNGTSTVSKNVRVGGIYGSDNGNGTSATFPRIAISNSLSAGKIDVIVNAGTYGVTQVGAVIGRAGDANSTTSNVYATTEITTKNLDAAKKSVTTMVGGASTSASHSCISWIGNDENLLGYGARLLTELPYTSEEGTNLWASRANNLPIPASLADVVTDELDSSLVGRADTSWYDGREDDASYTLCDIEDLYGFSVLSREFDFAGKTIYLANDIKVNDSEQVDSTWMASDWAEKDVSALLPWQQIGINLDGQRFAGTFDGKGYSISGLYMKQDINRMGLFGPTECGSLVKDVRLENSYFEQTGSGTLGSIVAECRGAVSGAYSNAILVSEANEVGGIVARANGYNRATDGDDETAGFTDKRISSSITNCWFDGTITSDKQYVGGIIASTRQGAWTMSNCLFTGTIYDNYTGSENAYIGGLCGEIKAQSIAEGEGSKILSSLDVQSCISTGTIHTTVLEKGIGSVVGRLSAGVAIVDDVAYENYTSLNMENVFVTRDAGSKVVGSIGSASNGDYSTKAKVIGYATQINNADRLIGYCVEEAVTDSTETYEAATLDFTSDSPAWILRTDGVPVPATFADMVNKVADYQLLNSEIGLTYLNETLNKTGDSALSIEKAVNQGVGNYVLSVEGVTLDTYKGYLEELKSEELGFKEYVDVDFENPVGTADDGVYNAIYTHKIADTEQVDWILNVLYVESTETMSITITSDESTLSPNLIAPTETTSTDKDITFAMLQLDGNKATFGSTTLYTYGSSYVFQLPDGDFIINDGGSVSGNDFNGLITFLAGLAGAEITATDESGVVTALDKDINIEAWTVSHQHNDHIGVLRQFMVQKVAKQIHVEAFYISEPNNRAIHIEDFTASSDDATFLYQELELQYQGMRMLTKSDGKTAPDIYRYQTGQRYYFDGITMDVIQSQEIIPVGNYGQRKASANLATDYNTASGTLLYTIQNGGQKILISGDANHKNMEYIMEMYGFTDGYTDAELLRGIDVFTALHHGKNSSYTIDSEEGYKTYTDYFLKADEQFAVALFPCSVYYGDKVNGTSTDYAGAFPYAKTANDYLKSKATNYYNYGNGNVVFTLKTDGTIDKQ